MVVAMILSILTYQASFSIENLDAINFQNSSSSSSCSWRFRRVSCSCNSQDEVGPSISSSVVFGSQRSTWSQGLHRWWYAKQTHPEKTNYNSDGVSENPTPTSTKAKAAWPWAIQLKMQQTEEGMDESPAPWNWAHSAKGAHPYRKTWRVRGIKVGVPPRDSPCNRPVTSPRDNKTLVKSSKGLWR
jgi:hypothetical protein